MAVYHVFANPLFPSTPALVERFAKAPFAILGVNTDESKEEYREQIAEHGVTWKNIFAGSTDQGVPSDWGVMAYPSTFLIDHHGFIRHRDVRGEAVENAVLKLLMEIED